MSDVANAIISQTAPAESAPPVDAAAPAKEKSDAVSPKFNVLAQKEKAIVHKQQEFQKKQQEWEKEKETILSKLKGYEEKDGISKQGAIKLLQAYGYSYEDATKEVMNEGSAEVAALDRKYGEKLTEMEKKLEAKEKERVEAEQKAKQEEIEKTINNYKDTLRGFIKDKSSEYKLVALFDGDAELVYDTIDAYFQQNNKVLSNAEATSMVEKYFKKLVEDANSALTPAQQQAGEKAMEQKNTLGMKDPKPVTRTLTNEIQMSTPSMLPAKTEQDRIRRALAALETKE